MPGFFSVIPLVVRRLRANFRLISAVIVGAVLASALLATTSIYTDAIHSLGLVYAIREKGVDRTNILVSSRTQPSRLEVYQKNRDFIDSVMASRDSILMANVAKVSRKEAETDFYTVWRILPKRDSIKR